MISVSSPEAQRQNTLSRSKTRIPKTSTLPASEFKLSKDTLKPGEKAELTGSIHTRSFLGQKVTTIGVVFDSPSAAEVQLQLQMQVRSDVMLEPGDVQFGSVHLGDSPQRTMSIHYSGRKGWRLVKVENQCPHLLCQTSETSRTDGRVDYRLAVSLKPSAPEGYIRQPIFLVTNDPDPQASRVLVLVEGLVRPRVMVYPNLLFFGTVEAGDTASRSLVIHAPTPFRILSIHSSDARWTCETPREKKSIYILPVRFSAPLVKEKISGKIRIETDQPGIGPFDVEARADVISDRQLSSSSRHSRD
jgi:hypothetical protein